MIRPFPRLLPVLVGLLLAGGLSVDSARAQAPADSADRADRSSSSRLHLGAHLGLPTGVGLVVPGPRRSVDALAAWGVDRYLFTHVHVRLLEAPFPPRPELDYYVGPGLGVRIEDGLLRAGPSVEAGLRYRADPLVFFLQAAPRLEIVPSTHLAISLGVGAYVQV